jgi:hypothetical protein
MEHPEKVYARRRERRVVEGAGHVLLKQIADLKKAVQ